MWALYKYTKKVKNMNMGGKEGKSRIKGMTLIDRAVIFGMKRGTNEEKRENAPKALIAAAMAARMIASVFVAMVPTVSTQAGVNGLTGIKLWHVLLTISIILAILTFTYPLISKRRKRNKEEEVIKILKEAKELKNKIEEKEEGLTTPTDVILTQILSTLNTGISDLKALILFGIATLVAINLTIISLL